MLRGLYGKLIRRFDPWAKSKRLADKRAVCNFLKEIRGGRTMPDQLTGAPEARASK